MGFNSASLFPVRIREAVTQGGTRRIDHPREPAMLKAGRTSETVGIFQTHSLQTRITRA